MTEPASTPAEPTNDPAPAAPAAPDYGFIPDAFKGEDGTFDTAAFRASYDDNASALAEYKARHEGAPETADGYSFALPDDFNFEGVEGLPDDFTSSFDAGAQAFKTIAAALHTFNAPQAVAMEIAKAAAMHDAEAYAAERSAMMEDIKSLGPNSEKRINDVRAKLEAKLSPEQANGIMAATVTAAGVQALETLLSSTQHQTPTPTPQKPDLNGKSGRELLRMQPLAS